MKKWYNLGMSHPLRLNTFALPQRHNSWARGVTVAVVLGVATLSAPLTIAETHPDKALTDTVVTSKSGKSVIKINKTDENGNQIKKHFEIELKGDEFEAYEFDKTGKKTKIEMSEIEGYDAEKAQNSNSWSFSIGDDNKLKFDTGQDIANKSGNMIKFKTGRGNATHLRVVDSDNTLEHYKVRQHDGDYRLESEEIRVDAQLAAAKSMLESVKDMLSDIEENDDTKSDLRKVRRELKMAQKNLKEAETRLRKEKAAE